MPDSSTASPAPPRLRLLAIVAAALLVALAGWVVRCQTSPSKAILPLILNWCM